MTDYDNRLTWTLFKVDPDKVRPNGPTYSGTFTDDTGAEFYIDAWVKTAKSGRSFFSGKAKRKQARQEDVVEKVRQGVNQHFATGLDDDIPFAPEWR